MPIIVLNDVILPNSVIAAGISGKRMRRNTRVEHGETGYQTINVGWSRSLMQYELGFVAMSLENWQIVQAIYEITEGGAYGFLMQDPTDNAGSGVVTLTAGTYQLERRYVDGASSRYSDRTVTRPAADGLVLQQNGIPLASSAYSVDETTGKITVSGNPDPATLSWSGGFYIPVHFESDMLDWEMVRPGPMEQRLIAGPSVVLTEVRE
jgi:uncharacterized protein (TIGR02217 family)